MIPYNEEDEETFHDENKQNMKEDKILNNSFNSGEIEYQVFRTPIRIDDRVAGQYRESWSETIVEDRTIKLLEARLFQEFENSEFFEKYKNPKRVDKSDMIKMYYFFKEKLLDERAFSDVEIFIGFAEFFQINYDQLYAQVGVKDKEGLIRELHEKLHLSKKIKTKKLF
jgi:hypothetical protein